MDETTRIGLAGLFFIGGVLLILLRHRIVPWLLRFYRRLGIDVPEQSYVRQFAFIGVLMILFGFLVLTNLFERL